ncbi:hypothetical protein VNO80_17055 [Phaseolus coccineus]|uniref:Uncharacterized protein n=1 Tax=Phaseolus coccineus TaxID=3886 RepID=A0AAN9MSG2_PHACN
MISAYGQCSLKDIHVTQSRTGRTVGGKPEWGVTITNWCACVQQNVKLNCKGFQTVEGIEPSLLNVSGDVCLVTSAYGQCSLKDIHVTQSRTGRTVGGKPEWGVTITNWCACVQQNVKLNCKGFQTVEGIEPSLLNVSGDVCLVTSAYGQCSLKDIHVTQSRTGRTVGGKPEWGVTITNWCACVQQNVKLNCKGFQTVEGIEPSLLNVSGDVCLVTSGKPIIKLIHSSPSFVTEIGLLLSLLGVAVLSDLVLRVVDAQTFTLIKLG